jgi:cellulose synthase/poly-beta-1,6-N-acetylglucosamine synthase-like glycosyltransferase
MHPNPTQRPFVSIIIPTYNRPDRLARCLHALTQQTYPAQLFEVIVVDDGSEPPVNLPLLPIAATLLRQPNAGPAAARNAGAAQAQGQYLAFTDDDCTPTPTWLDQLVRQLGLTPNALVGGHTQNLLPHNRYATASQLLIDYLYTVWNGRSATPHFFTSNNFALSRAAFEEVGGFNTTMPLAAGEDREFCDRWQQAQRPLHHVPSAIIGHAHPLTLRTFWRQHTQYGRGAWQFHKIRAARHAAPIQIEPLTFYLRLLAYPFTQHPPHRALPLTLLLALSQLANAIGFFRERHKKR